MGELTVFNRNEIKAFTPNSPDLKDAYYTMHPISVAYGLGLIMSASGAKDQRDEDRRVEEFNKIMSDDTKSMLLFTGAVMIPNPVKGTRGVYGVVFVCQRSKDDDKDEAMEGHAIAVYLATKGQYEFELGVGLLEYARRVLATSNFKTLSARVSYKFKDQLMKLGGWKAVLMMDMTWAVTGDCDYRGNKP
jgi:hypothetical protein